MTKTCSTACLARRCAPARLPTHSTLRTCGRTRTPPARTRRYGRQSSRPGIPTWWHWKSATSNAGTPYFAFKDMDENKPTGSIRIRVETIDYFLKRYREDLLKKAETAKELERQLAEYERSLRMQLTHKSLRRDDVVIPFPQPEPETASAAG